MNKDLSRRHFLGQSLLASSGLLLAGQQQHLLAEDKDKALAGAPDISLFTKHFQGLEFDALADAIAETGAKCVDAPIRKGGHVEPERVEEDLPKLAEAFSKRGLKMNLITSGINAVAADQHTEKVLRAAKAAGVTHYRMNYFRYDLEKPVWAQMDEWRPIIKDLVALSKEIGITPVYQNHSGKNYFGGPIWDAYSIMREYDAKDFAFAFDIMHAMIEGGKSWPLELALVKDSIGVVYFKNFTWGEGKFENVPLSEGAVSADYVKALKKQKWQGPVSLHVEYLKGSVKDEGYLKNAIAKTKADYETLTSWWK